MVPTISEKVSMKGIEVIHGYLLDNGIITAPGNLRGFVDLRFLPQ
jgi:hypothetical protein